MTHLSADATLTRSERLKTVSDEYGLRLGLAGLFLWFVAVATSNYGSMSGYGLVSVLGWPYFLGLILVVVGFGLELMRSPLRPRRLMFLIVVLVLFLYGTGPAVEPIAAMTDSWIHAGFIQYILLHGHALNGFDARMSWPGAFSMSALLAAFVGKANVYGLLRWFPLFIELAYLAPLLVIARFSGIGRRAGWLGIALYYSSNWIYQDYFSPQALNFLFYLVVIATVMACWQPVTQTFAKARPGSLRYRITQGRQTFTRDRLYGHHSQTSWGATQLLGGFALVSLILFTSAISHQLTPYALIIALTCLLATRRSGRPELVILIFVFALGWLSLGASNYWVGHLSTIFGSVGQFSNKLSSNVTSRVTGVSTHVLVVELRILLTGGIFALAGIGVLRRCADTRTLEALVAGPFLLFAAQSYGGEGLIRVVLFGLPFTAMLAATAFLPSHKGSIRSFIPAVREGRFYRLYHLVMPTLIVAAVLTCALAMTVVRGGNDAYASFPADELASVNYVYDHIAPGQVIGLANYFMPIGQRKIGVVTEYFAASDTGTASLSSVTSHFLKNRPRYIILAKSQEQYGVQVSGLPVGWVNRVKNELIASGVYTVVAHWPTSVVLKLVA